MQVHRDAGNGSFRVEPGIEVVLARKIAAGCDRNAFPGSLSLHPAPKNNGSDSPRGTVLDLALFALRELLHYDGSDDSGRNSRSGENCLRWVRAGNLA